MAMNVLAGLNGLRSNTDALAIFEDFAACDTRDHGYFVSWRYCVGASDKFVADAEGLADLQPFDRDGYIVSGV